MTRQSQRDCVSVTHESARSFALGISLVFVAPGNKIMIAEGAPQMLLAESQDPTVR